MNKKRFKKIVELNRTFNLKDYLIISAVSMIGGEWINYYSTQKTIYIPYTMIFFIIGSLALIILDHTIHRNVYYEEVK